MHLFWVSLLEQSLKACGQPGFSGQLPEASRRRSSFSHQPRICSKLSNQAVSPSSAAPPPFSLLKACVASPSPTLPLVGSSETQICYFLQPEDAAVGTGVNAVLQQVPRQPVSRLTLVMAFQKQLCFISNLLSQIHSFRISTSLVHLSRYFSLHT